MQKLSSPALLPIETSIPIPCIVLKLNKVVPFWTKEPFSLKAVTMGTMKNVQLWAGLAAASLALIIAAEAVLLFGTEWMPQLKAVFWLATALRIGILAFLIAIALRLPVPGTWKLIFTILTSLATLHLLYATIETVRLVLHVTGLATAPTFSFLHFSLVWLAFGVPGILLALTARAYQIAQNQP
jgi:hypothetical protein